MTAQKKTDMKVVEKQKAGELSLFDSQHSNDTVIAEEGSDQGDKMAEDLREIRKFLEELYTQLDDE
ncbi:MAG: hypothetical protein UZ05_CHB002002859 [Chlorobi bacterium OLB5]|nr:MAG: hypothetical protein UZ05_CHB002002859 [Chlorobi bacterium OLB5]